MQPTKTEPLIYRHHCIKMSWYILNVRHSCRCLATKLRLFMLCVFATQFFLKIIVWNFFSSHGDHFKFSSLSTERVKEISITIRSLSEDENIYLPALMSQMRIVLSLPALTRVLPPSSRPSSPSPHRTVSTVSV